VVDVAVKFILSLKEAERLGAALALRRNGLRFENILLMGQGKWICLMAALWSVPRPSVDGPYSQSDFSLVRVVFD
jgi:hypothetical protein